VESVGSRRKAETRETERERASTWSLEWVQASSRLQRDCGRKKKGRRRRDVELKKKKMEEEEKGGSRRKKGNFGKKLGFSLFQF
jgi:hypothetical protein